MFLSQKGKLGGIFEKFLALVKFGLCLIFRCEGFLLDLGRYHFYQHLTISIAIKINRFFSK